MKFYIGIDQSKRSTGCVMLDESGSIKSHHLIYEPKLDNEQLMVYQWDSFDAWIGETIGDRSSIAGALIEGLSFGSVGSSKDFLAGLQWHFRAKFLEEYNRLLGTIPVSMWRSKVLDKDEQKLAKAVGKTGLKEAVVSKLSVHTKNDFMHTVKSYGKKDSLYDLADAFFIAKHCHNLFTCK